MVVMGFSWALTLALSTRRAASKASFFSSSCLLVMRRGLRGLLGDRSVLRVAVKVIWLWSEERRLSVLHPPKVTRPFEATVMSIAEEGTHLREPGYADLVNDPSLRIRDVLASALTTLAITLPDGLAREACPHEGCLALKSPPMQYSAPERDRSMRVNQSLNSLFA